jgi:hypothetical protein
MWSTHVKHACAAGGCLATQEALLAAHACCSCSTRVGGGKRISQHLMSVVAQGLVTTLSQHSGVSVGSITVPECPGLLIVGVADCDGVAGLAHVLA